MLNITAIAIIGIIAIIVTIVVVVTKFMRKKHKVDEPWWTWNSWGNTIPSSAAPVIEEEKPRTVRVYSFYEGKEYTLTGTGKGIPLGDYFLAKDEEVRNGRVCKKTHPVCELRIAE